MDFSALNDYYKTMPTKKSKKKKSGLGFALWLLGLIIILIIFLVKKDDIVSNLKTTRAFERLGLETPEFVEKHEVKPVKDDEPITEETVITLNTKEKQKPVKAPVTAAPAPVEVPTQLPQQSPVSAPQPVEQVTQQPTAASEPVSQADAVAQKTESPAEQTKPTATSPAQQEKPKPAPAPVKTNAKLYFVVIENDGAVSRKQVTRSINKTNSPLSENIKQLLAGPNQAERAKGCISLIPEGTRLLSASVSGGTAMLNFSEEFEYNRVGVEGYLGQLAQIVYTATEFSTVTGVQILIDGQKKEYLGSEGVWIGSPLSRASF